METTIVTSKHVRQRLGTLILDIKYKPEDIIVVEKPGSDDFVCVLTNPQFLRDQGIDIPAKAAPAKAKSDEKTDEKPETKKKK
jgi:hypothetical protein